MVTYTNKSISDYTPPEIRGIQSRDETANSVFLKACEFLIERYARKFAGPREFHFDDLMQTGRLAALEAAWQFEIGKGYFAGYITTSIRNAIYTVGRKRQIERKFYTNESSLNSKQNRFDSPIEHDGFERVDREDSLTKIRSKISEWRKTLSPKKNQLIGLIFDRRLNQLQAAAEMGTSRQNVNKMLQSIVDSGRQVLSGLELEISN